MEEDEQTEGRGRVYLRCVAEEGRLRVRIISAGYYHDANCQFPRSIRREDRIFSVPPESVRLSSSRGGTYFYRVRDPITIEDEAPADEELNRGMPVGHAFGIPIVEEATTRAMLNRTEDEAVCRGPVTRSRKRKASELESTASVKIYNNAEEPDCVVCLERAKALILVPCGHFCLCELCLTRIGTTSKKCPLCRQTIQKAIKPSQMT